MTARTWFASLTRLERLLALLCLTVVLLTLAVGRELSGQSHLLTAQRDTLAHSACVSQVNSDYQAALGVIIAYSLDHPGRSTPDRLHGRLNRALGRPGEHTGLTHLSEECPAIVKHP